VLHGLAFGLARKVIARLAGLGDALAQVVGAAFTIGVRDFTFR